MTNTEIQPKGVATLRALNNSIVTSRLYPPEAPQVATAVDRGYREVKGFVRGAGMLELSSSQGQPQINGQELDREVLASFPNLVVYRQLKFLNFSGLRMGPEMDRFAFSQLLSVFNASPEKIDNEGGGQQYVTTLGLSKYFYTHKAAKATELSSESGKQKLPSTPKKFRVRPELVSCLMGTDKRPLVLKELRQKFVDQEVAVQILSVTVAEILKNIKSRNQGAISPYFTVFVKNTERLLAPEHVEQVTQETAQLLTDRINGTGLGVLFWQDFSTPLGGKLYTSLLESLSTEKFAEVVFMFREKLARQKLLSGAATHPEGQQISRSFIRLLSTKKGKQFLSNEKAKELLSQGEQKRRKQRLETGLKSLLEKNHSVLSSSELIRYLPRALRALVKGGKDAHVYTIVDNAVAYFNRDKGASEPVKERENKRLLLESFVEMSEDAYRDKNEALISHLIDILMESAAGFDCGPELFARNINLLHNIMRQSYRKQDDEKGDRILALLHRIRSGQTQQDSKSKNIVARIQDAGIDRAAFPDLLKRCLADPKDESLSYRLVFQGPVASRFLLEKLIKTDELAERIKLIDLLTYNSHYLPPIITERLPAHMPWYGKRNLIKLLGEAGSPADAEALLPYFRHEDFRVQRETFLTVHRISGGRKKRIFLKALGECTGEIKIQLVEALGKMGDPEITTHLLQVLKSYQDYGEQSRDRLLLQTLDSLGRCNNSEALKGVQEFLLYKGQRQARLIGDDVWTMASATLKQLEQSQRELKKKYAQAGQLRKSVLKQVARTTASVGQVRISTGLPGEKEIRRLVAGGDLNGAVVKLVALIEKTARSRNFTQAESLRKWLLEIDSTAIDQIVRVTQLIEKEKDLVPEKSHLEIWSDLYDMLSTKEFKWISKALLHRTYQGDEVVVRQGDMHPCLYFINSGKVKLFYEQQGGEVLVETMGPGEILGAGAFFSASVWTISIGALGPANISIFKAGKVTNWEDDFPELKEKLQRFCKENDRVEAFLKKNSQDRRQHERIQLSGGTTLAILDNSGMPTGMEYRGELLDISEGGIACRISIEHRERVRQFLGKKAQIDLPGGSQSNDRRLLVGDVLAIRKFETVEGEYSLHIRFDELIEPGDLQAISQDASGETVELQ